MPVSRLSLTFLSVILMFDSYAQHPHILVNDADKPSILQKIKEQPWAKSILEEMRSKVSPYVERHTTDPQWMLSRYQMNRIPGKYYTTVFSDEANFRDGKLSALYLGKGREISNSGYVLTSLEEDGSACLAIRDKEMTISCNQAVEIAVPGTIKGKIILENGETSSPLNVARSGNQLIFTVQAVTNGRIIIN